ncbi:hypothetical protein K432DRAFT_115133 [Lepidopterella palustris CBS 459.81]|uniref:Uncharacterized protein n=1 Tax=Lepidopterella palustris CBS 459.81 TaxID=1314670 RepID=A0A8E2E581_9PEZI|nr:hypothetical protein K432DRAFT_115133 [Lepidopterella palustris CBS 459.81]
MGLPQDAGSMSGANFGDSGGPVARASTSEGFQPSGFFYNHLVSLIDQEIGRVSGSSEQAASAPQATLGSPLETLGRRTRSGKLFSSMGESGGRERGNVKEYKEAGEGSRGFGTRLSTGRTPGSGHRRFSSQGSVRLNSNASESPCPSNIPASRGHEEPALSDSEDSEDSETSTGSSLSTPHESPERRGALTIGVSGLPPPHTPMNADITLLGTVEITAEELLTFFPAHLRWFNCTIRLASNGWTQSDMANFVNWSRALLEPNTVRSNTLTHRIRMADEAIYGTRLGVKNRRKNPTTDFTAASWIKPTRSGGPPIDYRLADLADGVVRPPTDRGRRELSMAVEYAMENRHMDLKLSDAEGLIAREKFSKRLAPLLKPSELKRGSNPDTIARDRNRVTTRAYAKMVKEDAEAKGIGYR